MRRIWAFIQLGRPHFLIGGLVLHSLGVMMAWYTGVTLNLHAFLWGQIAVTVTQLMTHYANDYFDLAADRLNPTPTAWSGGSRVLVRDRLPPHTALIAALILAGIALSADLVLGISIRPGLATFALLALAQALAWCYSAPPLRLHSTGLGEVTATLIVVLLTPLIGYTLQAGEVAMLPIIALLPLLCLQFNMLLAVEFPDVAGDREAGKHNLLVRLGPVVGARLYAVLLILTYALLLLLGIDRLPTLVILFVWALNPLALWQMWRTVKGDYRNPAHWGRFAFFSIVLLVGTALAELMAFALAA